MRIRGFLKQFAFVFAAVLVSNAAVVYLWNLVFHGEGVFDWGLTFTLAITIGIAVALATARKT
jgi:low affinity Fe/Cu permease